MMSKTIEDSKAEVVCENMPTVSADELQLGQVFQNLLGNALKFHGERAPRIQVRAESIENGTMWRFSIADLTRESLSASTLRIELTVVVTGAEALEFMHKQGRFASASRPDLILLDLNLPGIDGRAVLQDIKRDADLKRIPVCILTSSAAENDVLQGYNLGANCYVVKPIDFKTFQNIVQAIESFWFAIVKLPTPPGDVKSWTKQNT